MKNLTLCKILTFVRFFSEALFFPFISLYLESKGINISQIGIILAAIPITSMVCAPIYSRICTNPTKTKRALLIMSGIEAIFVLFMTFANSFVYFLIVIILISIISSSNYGMIDSLLTYVAEDHGKRYSSIRIYGSISYMCGVLISGIIARYISYHALFYIACSLFFVVFILYFFITPPVHQEEEKQKPKFKEILQKKFFISYLIFYVLFIGTMQVGDDFFSLYMVSKGATEYDYSLVMFGFISVEIITMILLNRFGKKLGIQIFFVSLILLVVRNVIHCIPQSPLWLIITAQMVRGVIWATALFLSSTFISKILGYEMASSGIILVLLGVQIFNSIFKFSGGYIIDLIGYPYFYMILCGISCIALMYFYFFFKAYNRSQIEQN